MLSTFTFIVWNFIANFSHFNRERLHSSNFQRQTNPCVSHIKLRKMEEIVNNLRVNNLKLKIKINPVVGGAIASSYLYEYNLKLLFR